MSDLAPFVATVLHDQTMMDLQDELKVSEAKVKKLENELRVIRVTGPNGSPVYAERHFQYAHEDEDNDIEELESWNLDLLNSTGDLVKPSLASCPTQDIDQCELHVGGKEIFVLGDFDDRFANSNVGDKDFCLSYLFGGLAYSFGDDEEDGYHRYSLQVTFGPNSYPENPNIVPFEEMGNEAADYVHFTSVGIFGNPFKGATT